MEFIYTTQDAYNALPPRARALIRLHGLSTRNHPAFRWRSSEWFVWAGGHYVLRFNIKRRHFYLEKNGRLIESDNWRVR